MSLLDALLLDPHRLNVWVAVRTDGVRGSGSVSDPYNGSTATLFDGVMNQLAQSSLPVCIHLGPGIFETCGYSDDAPDAGWQPSPNMKILGAGIDVTTLRLVGCDQTHGQYFAVGHALATEDDPGVQADFFEISDLTIDCNLDGQGSHQVACGALRIKGRHSRIRRVKAVDWGTKSSSRRCYVFSSIMADPHAAYSEIFDSVFDSCLAMDRNASADSAVIVFHAGHAGGTDVPDPKGESAVISNCYVDGTTAGGAVVLTQNIIGLSVGRCHGTIVDGNQVHNVRFGGPWQDEVSVPEVIVRGNLYRNVVYGPWFNLGSLSIGLAISGIDRVKLTTSETLDNDRRDTGRITTTAGHGFTPGDRVKISGTAGFNGFFRVRDIPEDGSDVPQLNQLDFYLTTNPGEESTGTVQQVRGVDKLLIEGNVIELALPTVSDPTPVGIFLNDNSATFLPHDQVIVRDNRFRYVEGPPAAHAGYAMQINGAGAVFVSDNWIETVPPGAEPIQTLRCDKITFFDNRTFAGVLLPRLDQETEKYLEEWDVPAEDALVSACFAR